MPNQSSNKQLHHRVFLPLFRQAFHTHVAEAAETANGDDVTGLGGMAGAFAQAARHKNLPRGEQGLGIRLVMGITEEAYYTYPMNLNNLVLKVRKE